MAETNGDSGGTSANNRSQRKVRVVWEKVLDHDEPSMLEVMADTEWV